MKRARAVSKSIRVRSVQLEHARGLALPAYQTEGSAGLDLQAAIAEAVPIVLKPGQHALIPTGLQLELPHGLEAQVRPRSGLAAKHGVTVLNSPGTIDSDYRGEVKVILINLGQEPFVIRRGERIAQMVVSAHARIALVAATGLGATKRGAGGFGSTGTAAAKSTKAKTGPKIKKAIRAGRPGAATARKKPGRKR